MPKIDIEIETAVSNSIRARQLSSMFDVPLAEKQKLNWQINAPWEEKDWNIGLIVGPSGSGKSTIMKHIFGEQMEFVWDKPSVIDDFSTEFSVDEISKVCSAVGFNTIPAWLRPFNVLSNGEQFRATLARAILESPKDKPIVMDEFTSVVDRQVAQIGSYAVQKKIRADKKQFVAVTCHYDILDWLQPDWVIDASTQTFSWGSVQPRPKVNVSIRRVGYEYWHMFAKYHYMSATLNKAARCFALFIDEQPVAFCGVLYRPHPVAKNIMGISRVVTLPDWQGLGLAFVLTEAIGSAYKAVGKRLRNYPAHPAFIRAHDKSPKWSLKQKPGFGTAGGNVHHGPNSTITEWRHGSRPCAVFEYIGEALPDKDLAEKFISGAYVTQTKIK